MISFSKAMKSIYGKSKTALPVNPEEVYIQSKLAGEFAGEKFAVRLFGRKGQGDGSIVLTNLLYMIYL